MCHKHCLLTIICLLFLLLCCVPLCPGRASHPASPLKGPGCWGFPVVAGQFGVMQEVPHEPDLRDIEAVNNHEFAVETRIKCLKVGRGRGSVNPEGSETFMAQRFDTDQLKAHSQKDIINGEKLHLKSSHRTERLFHFLNIF